MSKHKDEHEEHVDETWLIPYADLLTLLLALFIVLFAASSINKSKFEQLIRTFQSEFKGGTGPLTYASITPEMDPDSSKRDTNKTLDENEEKYFEEQSKQKTEEMNRLEEIKKQIDIYIKEHQLEEKFKTILDKEGLKLLILDSALFASGSAQIVGEYKQIAADISNLLVSDIPRRIMISGHTDNQPISKNYIFKSNWELSTARATNFLQAIIENDKLDQSLFSVSGHGEFRPIDTNDTEEGRANNRRVEVLILPNFDVKAGEG